MAVPTCVVHVGLVRGLCATVQSLAARLAVQRVDADYRGSNRSALPLLRCGATGRRALRLDVATVTVPLYREKGDDGEVGWVR